MGKKNGYIAIITSERIKSWGLASGLTATSTPYPNIRGSKVMLCGWWDQLGVIYYELLKPSETITGERYRTQLMRLSRAQGERKTAAVQRETLSDYWTA
nr:transposase [Hymenolepis microstoma]